MNQNSIRNFCIIAHIDHGKSTLADRLLEITGTIPKDKAKPQLLDSLALERERGITIKLAPVRMRYKIPNNKLQISNKSQIQNTNNQNSLRFDAWDLELASSDYILNLIDTPGHVDFSYEVSRALAAVEGAVLLVDATVGIQAQTLAHGLAALDQNLVLIPAINKIDLPNADIEGTKKQLVDTFGFNENELLLVSGKTGAGVEILLQAIINRIPPPPTQGVKLNHPGGVDEAAHWDFRALIFDSFFDSYKGVVAQVRVVEGQTPPAGSKILFLGTKREGQVLETGIFTPQLNPQEKLTAGEIGYIATGIKKPDEVRVGDTIMSTSEVETILRLGGVIKPLPGYKSVKPMVFVGLYPIDQDEYRNVKEALEKFRLNDPAFTYTLEHSHALGAGFRCGFLGLLHAEVVQERLSSEFGAQLIATTPSVAYEFEGKLIENPTDLPSGELGNLKEPWVSAEIFIPQSYIGPVMDLLKDRRAKFINMRHFGGQASLSYEMPLSEMITDFYDRLKSLSSGFASLDWEFIDFREVSAVRLDILVAGEKVDALSNIVVRQKAESIGRRIVEKLKEVLPRQQFEIPIQAAIGGKIIARQTLSAFRKDVTQKLYGGDRTRKDKLLEAQKKGKKRMKKVGKVEIPQEAFLAVLKS